MKGVLLVTIGFSPNVGGIETHFDDLVTGLSNEGWKSTVLTYMPLTVDVSASYKERRGPNITIYRMPVIRNLFYKLVNNPILEFIYLIPGLFISLPILLMTNSKDIDVIHSHGLIAGFVSVIWGKIFNKRVLVTTHSIYNFPASGMYRKLATWIFKECDRVLTLSKQSKSEVVSLGINASKVTVFTYWIDLNLFKKVKGAKLAIGLKDKFTVLFVGRLIKEKGIVELLAAAKRWDKNIYLVIIGTGPLDNYIRTFCNEHSNTIFFGKVSNSELPKYYSAADLLIVPSVHEEGFGRVLIESMACGTPVLGSNRGAIPEAIDSSVGKLIEITPNNIKNEVEYYFNNIDKLNKMAVNTRAYAEDHYSAKNLKTIVEAYLGKM